MTLFWISRPTDTYNSFIYIDKDQVILEIYIIQNILNALFWEYFDAEPAIYNENLQFC